MLISHSPNQPVCRLVLVRHATARGTGSFLGQADTPLSSVGRRQLPALFRKLGCYRADRAYASDLRRARSTAAFAARRLGLRVEIRKGLREIHFGKWQGLSWDEIYRKSPAAAGRWMKRFPLQRAPGGEPFEQFKKRVHRELRELAANNQGKCVLIVTHAGVIRVALGEAIGLGDRQLFSLALDPCGVSVIEMFEGSAVVRCINA